MESRVEEYDSSDADEESVKDDDAFIPVKEISLTTTTTPSTDMMIATTVLQDASERTENQLDQSLLDVVTARASEARDRMVAEAAVINLEEKVEAKNNTKKAADEEEEGVDIMTKRKPSSPSRDVTKKSHDHDDEGSGAAVALEKEELKDKTKGFGGTAEKERSVLKVGAGDPTTPTGASEGNPNIIGLPGEDDIIAPRLAGTITTTSSSAPGAYDVRPGRDPSSSVVVDLSSDDEDEEDIENGESIPARVDPTTTEQLAEASPVLDYSTVGGAIRQQANPVNTEEEQKRRQKVEKQQILIFLLLIIVVATAGAIIGSLFRKKQQKNNNTASSAVSSMAPSVTSSTEVVPSAAPTGNLDLLLLDLPSITLERMQIYGTPQWKAWDWLTNHNNITHLEEWRKKQLFSLATFFYSLEGENWNQLIQERWMDDTVDECFWFSGGFGYFLSSGEYREWGDVYPQYYVPPCNDLGEFTSLSLRDLQLSGLEPSVPLEIALLTSLDRIEISASDLELSLSTLFPSAFYQMTALKALEVNTNRLLGPVPTQLGKLTALEVLMLQANELTGTIPSQVDEMTNLKKLLLDRNQLTGPLSSELGLLTALVDLSVNENQLTGPVPSEIGLLHSLEWLYLHANQLTNTIPTEIGSLTDLVSLRMYENQLTGQMPSELALLTSLTWGLRLSDNQLSGTIPTEIGLLSELNWFGLANNFLTGTLPTEVALMTSLDSSAGLYVQNNNLTGALPNQLNQTMGLRLDGNQFSGTVPLHLCSFLLCDCSTNVSLASTCENLKVIPDYPGRFPPMTTAGSVETTLMLNVHTDKWPEETSWTWQQKANETNNETDVWETLEGSGGGLGLPLFLFSQNLTAASSNSTYRIVVSDIYGDGFSDGAGWITLTASNETVLYSFLGEGSFAEVTVVVTVAADGSFKIMPSLVN